MESPMGVERPRASPMDSRYRAASQSRIAGIARRIGMYLGWLTHRARNLGKGVVQDALLPHRPQNVPGPGLPGAVRRAVIAVMAQPYIRVPEKLILHPPKGPCHFFPRERMT